MFPETIISATEATEEGSGTMGTSFSFDFTAGDFRLQDGRPVKAVGIEAIKVWIQKVLRTERGKFAIYGDYGVSFKDLLNKGYPQVFVENEAEREIKEALEKNAEIIRVYGFVFSRDKRGLSIAFNVDTIYGVTESEVIV